MSRTQTPEQVAHRLAKARATRTDNNAATRPTTRPGSETTGLRAGDCVRVIHASGARSGAWKRYDGRTGWVAVVSTQKFPGGRLYTEVGLTWHRHADWAKAAAETWFRADELERISDG